MSGILRIVILFGVNYRIHNMPDFQAYLSIRVIGEYVVLNFWGTRYLSNSLHVNDI